MHGGVFRRILCIKLQYRAFLCKIILYEIGTFHTLHRRGSGARGHAREGGVSDTYFAFKVKLFLTSTKMESAAHFGVFYPSLTSHQPNKATRAIMRL